MSRKFWLKEITIHRSPGFASGTFPPVEKLGQHLNVIWGPNAVGKSTLSRAMRCLIWDHKSSRDVEAEGLLKTPDSDWHLSLSQGRLTQTRLDDNRIITLPGRNDELSESYWFTLHELLQENEGSTDAFLRQVRTSMQGGVDIDRAAREAGAILFFSSGNIAQAKQVRLASEELEQVLKEQGQHQGIQDSIDVLQEEVSRSASLSERKASLESAKALIELKDTIEEQEQKLALYPPSMALIDKSSPKRLQELLDARTKAKSDELSYTNESDHLHQEFASCGIGEQELGDLEKPNRVANKFDAYKDAFDRKKVSEKELGAARQELSEWEDEHSWLVGGPVESKTLEAYVDRLKTLAQECEPLRCDVGAKKRLLDELGEQEEIQTGANDLALLQIRISDWLDSFWQLQGTAKTKALREGTKRWLLLLMLVIGGVSSYLGFALQPVFFGVGFMLTLLSVALLVPSSVKNSEYKRAEEALMQASEEVKRLCKQLDIDCPSSWTPEHCQRKSVELSSEIASLHALEQLNRRRKVAKDQFEHAREKLQKWTSDWQGAVKALGLKGDEALLEGSQFFHFAERLQTWSELRLAFVKKQEAFSQAQREESLALSSLQAELDTQHSELATLKAKSDSLTKRLRDALSLQASIKENTERLYATREQLSASEEAIKEFWHTIQLEIGNEAELTELVAKLDQWNDLRFSLKHNRNVYDKRSNASADALAMASTHTYSDLSDALEKLLLRQQELEQKREELGGLRATFERLKFGSDLATAQQKKEAALAELDSLRSEQVMARMVASLGNDLTKESEKQFQPQVLKHASRWLSDITSHRYTLSANNEGFFATDTIMAKTYNLDELSSGTRVQLLFSIRMAFITMQEETSGVSLPIFLDELLANSDDERALSITKAIGSIAEGRQVFYVTAQRDEVEKLKTIATSEVTVIPLEDLNREFRLEKDPLKAYVHTRVEVPAALEDYQQYARALSVAGASLWGAVERLHSWHLLADSLKLYSYLQQGLEHVGQLVAAKAEQEPSLAFRFQLLKAAQQEAQQGRAKKVQLADLNDPALDLNRSAKFWTQIQEVVGAEGCTGEMLLQAVEDKRIQRFTDANLDMLSNWLFENRFVSDKEERAAQAILEDLFVSFDAFVVGSDDERVVKRYLDAVIG